VEANEPKQPGKRESKKSGKRKSKKSDKQKSEELTSLAGNLPIHFIYWAFRKVDRTVLEICTKSTTELEKKANTEKKANDEKKEMITAAAHLYNIKIHIFQEEQIKAIYGPVFSSWFERCLKIKQPGHKKE
jgi:hypothetical protein